MRCFLILITCFLMIASANAADFGGPYQQPVQRPDQKGAQDRGGPSQPRDAGNQPEVGPQETGFYQAGPRSGAFEGPSGAIGLRGGGITLPELKLGLPTLEFPSIFRSHHGARMVYKGGEAPWISTGFAAGGTRGVAGRGDDDASRGTEDEDGARSRGTQDECLELRSQQQEYQRKLEELDRKLEQCNKVGQLLEERLREQAAAAAAPAHDYYGQSEMRRLPAALGLPAHYNRTPLPVAQLPNNSEIQRASYSTAQFRHREPALLQRLPQDNMLPITYPNTADYSAAQGARRVYR